MSSECRRGARRIQLECKPCSRELVATGREKQGWGEDSPRGGAEGQAGRSRLGARRCPGRTERAAGGLALQQGAQGHGKSRAQHKRRLRATRTGLGEGAPCTANCEVKSPELQSDPGLF